MDKGKDKAPSGAAGRRANYHNGCKRQWADDSVRCHCRQGSTLPTRLKLESSSELISTFEVGAIPTEALMFQSGYLTIAREKNPGGNIMFTPAYPNREEQIYLFEFNVVEEEVEGKALARIREKQYASKYRSLNQPIHLIGVEFSRKARNVVGFEVESLN
jgi:hypothetical protein